MRTAMVISPHADDAAAICGATLAKFSDQGWRVILVTIPYCFIYPPEARRLREAMQERREIIVGKEVQG